MTVYEFEVAARRHLSLRPELLLMALMLAAVLAVAALALHDPRPAETEPLPAALPTAASFAA